jgi:histidinol-phosphate aminotransferase
MSLSRRSFCHVLGAAVPATLIRRDAVSPDLQLLATRARVSDPIRLDSNENPYGPSLAARAAAARALSIEGGRYPGPAIQALLAAIADANAISPSNVLLTVGSTEALAISAKAFTRPDAPLVTATPSYEAVAVATERLGHPVVRVPVTSDGRLDLEEMARRSQGAGLVYLCNPNNPTGATVPAAALSDFVARIGSVSPTTTILVGEAYHEYIETPSYRTAIPDSLKTPRMLVTRTFSKLYGLAGLRIGYVIGQEEPLRQLSLLRVGLGANIAAVAAASASIADVQGRLHQQRLNRDGRKAAERFFTERGWKVYPAEANYLFVDIRRDVVAFRAACAAGGLLIGRPYPPATNCARITIGTPEEMQRAFSVLETVLNAGT